MILAAVADSIVLGRQISRRVQEKFPKGDPTGMSTKGSALGYYAFNRAMLPPPVPRPPGAVTGRATSSSSGDAQPSGVPTARRRQRPR